MRHAVRAIVIKDGNLLVMHRNKFGTEYDTLPGGNIELNETPEQALLREVDEETMITVANPRLVALEHAGDPYGIQHVFLCEYVSGEPQLRPDSEEEHINKLGQNLYTPMWVSLAELPNRPFLSEKLKAVLLSGVQQDWPEEVLEIR